MPLDKLGLPQPSHHWATVLGPDGNGGIIVTGVASQSSDDGAAQLEVYGNPNTPRIASFFGRRPVLTYLPDTTLISEVTVAEDNTLRIAQQKRHGLPPRLNGDGRVDPQGPWGQTDKDRKSVV